MSYDPGKLNWYTCEHNKDGICTLEDHCTICPFVTELFVETCSYRVAHEKRKKENAKKYSDWIDEKYPNYPSAKKQCNEGVHAMVKRFPELQIRIGYANGIQHCWLVDEYGNTVDPTARQFKERPIVYRSVANSFLTKEQWEDLLTFNGGKNNVNHNR